MLWCWQGEDLREDSIDGYVLRLPRWSARLNVANFVESKATLRERVGRPIAVDLVEISRGGVAVKVKDVDRVNARIPKQCGSNGSRWWNRLDFLVREEREIDFRE